MAYTYVTRFLPGSGTNTGTLVAPAAGDLFYVDQNGVEITSAALAAAATGIRVIAGTGLTTIHTPILTRSAISRVGVGGFTEQDYSAPVAQVDTIDMTNFAAGDQVRIKVLFKTTRRLNPYREDEQEVYHTFAQGSTLTAEIDKIVAKINSLGNPGQARPTFSRYITAANSGGTAITLTAKPIPAGTTEEPYDFVSFQTFATELQPQGNYGTGVAYPVALTAKADGGSGLGVQVAYEEAYYSGYNGRQDPRSSFDRLQYGLQAKAGTNYAIIHLSGLPAIEGDFGGSKTTAIRTSLALPTGSAQLASAQAILRAFVAGTASSPPAGE